MRGLTDRLAERYAHDPAFRQMVDLSRAAIANLRLAPSEVREAATYAVFLEEMRVTRQAFLLEGDDERRECIPLLTDDRLAVIARKRSPADGHVGTRDEERAMAIEILTVRNGRK